MSEVSGPIGSVVIRFDREGDPKRARRSKSGYWGVWGTIDVGRS